MGSCCWTAQEEPASEACCINYRLNSLCLNYFPGTCGALLHFAIRERKGAPNWPAGHAQGQQQLPVPTVAKQLLQPWTAMQREPARPQGLGLQHSATGCWRPALSKHLAT